MHPKNYILAVPWDPTSPTHVERLRQQRISCGWGVENIPTWRTEHLAGQKLILWLILDPTHPSYRALLAAHTAQFPIEPNPLKDSSSTLLPPVHPIAQRPNQKFTPIGHVSLDFPSHISISNPDPVSGRIGASSLYLSPAVRGLEFASQAVETTKKVGKNFARWVVAEVPVRESQDAVERFERFGDGRPGFSLEEWYVSLGWKRIRGMKRFVDEKDVDGRIWRVELVAMEWDLGEMPLVGDCEKSRL
ncbi:hypothetical protein VTL71DRAFT_14858 [Oculimacula yallundae]|uniref:Uncharacterized protein n=1 Tax=Oculimacula yallundae TaxID=86028 RepID=A0ABR4CH02_9HELO